MLYDYLQEHKNRILEMTEEKSQTMSGVRPTPEQLRIGLPIFYAQLMERIKTETNFAVLATDEVDSRVSDTAGDLSIEMLKVGFTLSNVVHFYGCLCQAITQLASEQNFNISAHEFHDLNRCLDNAIAGAGTEYQKIGRAKSNLTEVKRCGFCAHELRNSLGAAVLSFELIKSGAAGLSGSLGQVLERSLKQMETLIGRSLMEVKLSSGAPELDLQPLNLLLLIDQLLLIANIEAKKRRQTIEVKIDPELTIFADFQFFHSALSNLIQNALKYSHEYGKIQIRASQLASNVVIEVEDECGGLNTKDPEDLFLPFEQFNQIRKGLGLGLSLARKAIELHDGTLQASNLVDIGCIFKITMPIRMS